MSLFALLIAASLLAKGDGSSSPAQSDDLGSGPPQRGVGSGMTEFPGPPATDAGLLSVQAPSIETLPSEKQPVALFEQSGPVAPEVNTISQPMTDTSRFLVEGGLLTQVLQPLPSAPTLTITSPAARGSSVAVAWSGFGRSAFVKISYPDGTSFSERAPSGSDNAFVPNAPGTYLVKAEGYVSPGYSFTGEVATATLVVN